jgi:hypothetical protein
VVVLAPRDPKVTATFPADGAKIAAGTVVLKIVFDQPMTPQAWSYGRAAPGAFPDCLARPRLLNDRRTFVLLCSLAVKTAYALEINAAPDFVTTAGRVVKPFVLRFDTTDAITLGLHDALAEAGLSDADDPIMATAGASGDVSAPPPPRDAAPTP